MSQSDGQTQLCARTSPTASQVTGVSGGPAVLDPNPVSSGKEVEAGVVAGVPVATPATQSGGAVGRITTSTGAPSTGVPTGTRSGAGGERVDGLDAVQDPVLAHLLKEFHPEFIGELVLCRCSVFHLSARTQKKTQITPRKNESCPVWW